MKLACMFGRARLSDSGLSPRDLVAEEGGARRLRGEDAAHAVRAARDDGERMAAVGEHRRVIGGVMLGTVEPVLALALGGAAALQKAIGGAGAVAGVERADEIMDVGGDVGRAGGARGPAERGGQVVRAEFPVIVVRAAASVRRAGARDRNRGTCSGQRPRSAAAGWRFGRWRKRHNAGRIARPPKTRRW